VGPAKDRPLTFLVRDLGGGGVQRSQLRLAGAFAARGHAVDLVTCAPPGPGDRPVREGVRLVVLPRMPKFPAKLLPLLADPAALHLLAPAMLTKARPSPTIANLLGLVRYLRRERPLGVLAAPTDLNLEAIWARRLAGVSTRIVVSERVHLSTALKDSSPWRQRHFPRLVRRYYPMADAIVAVSAGVADDLATHVGIPRERIATIFNPVVSSAMILQSAEPVDHPWFAAGAPPVVLGVGRLTAQKDFPTLIRAFARVRAERPVRLMILGEGKPEMHAELRALADSLGCAADVDLPGFAPNPFAYMALSGVFVLSSAWEGFGNVVVEALACGCPVVSTNCPSGPAEILDGGRYGALVPVGDDAAMAEAILAMLAHPPERSALTARGAEFSVDRAVERYLELLLCEPAVAQRV
jgi:glycosyltransferase involved in cell wall biosynthesis